MNQLLNKCVNLYAKSLIVAVPTGIIISNYEQMMPIEPFISFHKNTCATKIIDYSLGVIGPTIFNSMTGLMGSLIYPITGPLYFVHKLERYQPNLFKYCHQNDIIETYYGKMELELGLFTKECDK